MRRPLQRQQRKAARHTHHLDESRVNIGFREGRGLEIRLMHSHLPDKATRDALEAGWTSALDRLAGLFSSTREHAPLTQR